MISFEPGTANQLLINPRLSDGEKKILAELKNEFEKSFGLHGYFLVPSSGSSKAAGQSVKLIALSLESVLNSAARVNFYLNAKKENTWGLFLPDFHVAGLGVLARAHLAKSEVKQMAFRPETIGAEILSHDIQFLSLVPTQIFDLVKANVQAPACVKKVFVGGGFLNSVLKNQIAGLGWPVTETYGMTETCSMIAVRELRDSRFSFMPGVSGKIENEVLNLKCDSLLSAVIQKSDDVITVTPVDGKSWFKTEDRATIHQQENGSFLELHGRKSDYIKIHGEGVSLSELRDKIQGIGSQLGLSPGEFELLAVESERSGYQMVLVAEENVSENTRQDLVNLFNKASRPYERISDTYVLRQIPRTDLGKLKSEELKRIIKSR